MNRATTTAIVLRRREYGDFDLIVTMLTCDKGKRTLIAKSAKKSAKRFPPGILEPFNHLLVSYREGRRKGMAILEEATLQHALGDIRSDFVKTAYASYWAECISVWMEDERVRPDIYELLAFALRSLADNSMPTAFLSILFQMRFVGHEGFRPVLESCANCHCDIENAVQNHFCVDLSKGGVVCHQCPPDRHGRMHLSKGTLKQLLWIADGDLGKAKRARFTAQATAEATSFLEAFVPYHLGRQLKSLQYLHQIRR